MELKEILKEILGAISNFKGKYEALKSEVAQAEKIAEEILETLKSIKSDKGGDCVPYH